MTLALTLSLTLALTLALAQLESASERGAAAAPRALHLTHAVEQTPHRAAHLGGKG